MTSVYTWGCGYEGRLGSGQANEERLGDLIHITELENRPIKFVSAGRRTTTVLTEDGELIVYGEIAQHKPGCKVSIKDMTPPGTIVRGVACGLSDIVFYTANNEVWAWGQHLSSGPIKKIHEFDQHWKIKQIACGATHCLVLTDYGVFGFGNSPSGQLGLGTKPQAGMGGTQYKAMQSITFFNNKNIVQIACGGYHSLALTDRGEVYGFGAGTYGQLGNGSIVQSSDPILATALKGIQVNFIAAGPSHSIALSTQGKAYLFGRTESKQCNVTAANNACVKPVEIALKDEFFVYAAAAHSCTFLVTVSGKIFDYGVLWNNEKYNVSFVNQGTLNDKFIHQIWCGHYHAIALTGDMRVNISPSTLISNVQTALSDALHKDMTLVTAQIKRQVHGVIVSTLSGVIGAKILEDKKIFFKNEIDLRDEFKDLPPALVDVMINYCYGISSDVTKDDLKLLIDAGTRVKSEEFVKECKRIEVSEETFLAVPPDVLSQSLGKLFKRQDECMSDITFTFSDSPKKLHAHKIILSSRCEYFRGLFDLGMKESKQNAMHIDEWSSTAFESMLYFLYSDEFSVTGEHAIEVLQIATTYLIQRLIDKCEEFVVENMTLDNVVELFQLSEVMNAKQIERGCQFCVRRELKQSEAEKLPDFHKLTPEQQQSVRLLLAGGNTKMPAPSTSTSTSETNNPEAKRCSIS